MKAAAFQWETDVRVALRKMRSIFTHGLKPFLLLLAAKGH
jgi:hypothetical protein